MVLSAPGTVKGISEGDCSPTWVGEGRCLITSLDGEYVLTFGGGSCGCWLWWLGELFNWDSLDFKLVATPDIIPIALFLSGFNWGDGRLELAAFPEIIVKLFNYSTKNLNFYNEMKNCLEILNVTIDVI